MINFNKFRTPQYIFVIYIAAASLIIIIFRFIFPGSDAPLAIYSTSWRFTQGVLTLFNLFPALAFSALVIPFGIVSGYEESYQSFSEMFFKRLSVSVILAVIAAILYGFIFFLALPLAKNHEENMLYTGEMYRLSRQHMLERLQRGEWREASQFLAICDRIWYNNPDITNIRTNINRNLTELSYLEEQERESARRTVRRDRRSADFSSLSGGIQPVDAVQALNLAGAAFEERRFFDAHWLATVAGRLAIPGTPEVTNAARLASIAWDEISSLAPNREEEQRYRIFNLKLTGYKAMETGDWIRAYYIFLELTDLSPDDPDAKNFLAASETGAKETAFFIDEIDYSFGEISTGALFSLPGNSLHSTEGRTVIRFSSLTVSDDTAYGMDFEYMAFDPQSRLIATVESRYAKLTPIILNDTPCITVLTHALDRNDEEGSYESELIYGTMESTGIILNISYEDFLLLGEAQRGLANIQTGGLFTAAQKFNNTGFVQQIFHAEILNRLGAALFFLPMSIFVIVIGWRYRAMKKPRYLFAVMVFVLPVVFNGFIFLYRAVFNNLGIWLVLNIGFAAALTVYIIVLAAGLFASLIALAAQHT